MFTEKDMEDAIARDPERYLGEDGLELIARQYRIGGYIFDLLFKDRHGAKLIVEIQKGTLDRQHTYKILDYYEGFREKHPEEFIELMVLANKIPEERKRRLRRWGVEFHEIPESDFIPATSVAEPSPAQISSTTHVDTRRHDKVVIDHSVMKSYELFKEQKNRFVEEILRLDKNMTVKLNWQDLDYDKHIKRRKNWFTAFIPSKWGNFKAPGYGVHFTFHYYRDRKTNKEYVRFPVGVEKPLKREVHKQFKDDVVKTLNREGINLPDCRVWPDVGFGGAKLIEPALVTLADDSWEKVLKKYLMLAEFIDIVADTIKEYHDRGHFLARLSFPE